MKTLTGYLNESEENLKDVSKWNRVVADAFRRCVSCGNIKRLRDLVEVASEHTDISHMGKLEFLATHTGFGKDMRYTVEYLLSKTDTTVYDLSFFVNGVHELTDTHILGDLEGLNLQNKIIFRTQDTLRRL